MRKIILSLSITLSLGLTLAYAQAKKQKPSPANAQANKQKPPPRADAERVILTEPRDPRVPTREQVIKEAQEKFDNLPNVGTKINPRGGLDADATALETKIVAAFGKQKRIPRERAPHFTWLTSKKDIRHRGWIGSIRSVEEAPGGWAVTVTISPLVDDMKRRTTINCIDYMLETYAFDGKNLRHIESVAAPVAFSGTVLD